MLFLFINLIMILFIIGANLELFLSLKDKPPYTEMHLIEVYQIELPHTLHIISRLMWYVRLDQRRVMSPEFKCCQDTDFLQWIDAKDIAEQNSAVIEYLWSNELLEMAGSVATSYEADQTPFSTLVEYR